MDKVKALNVEQRINSIKLIDFKLSVLEESEKQVINKSKITFEFNISYIINEDNTIIIILLTKFFSDESKVLEIGDMKTEGVFEVINLKDILIEHDNKMPTIILSSFMGILISTTRGFLILKSKDTIMEGSIIPIVYPTQFFQDNKTQNQI